MVDVSSIGPLPLRDSFLDQWSLFELQDNLV